jgi:menaquinone-dependent protoporphyrinogen oxidase
MPVLVAYASRHGATQGIAERIAETLRASGAEGDVLPVKTVSDLRSYDAFVIGSAVYMFHWMKEATTFLRRNRELLVTRPVWLFSSGPLGIEEIDSQGRDVREVAAAKETGELVETVKAREHRMFFGAFQQGKPVGLAERMVMLMPAARDAFPEGDFRDWDEIDRWAEGIARALRAPT